MEIYLRQIVHDNRIPVEIKLNQDSITIGRVIRALIPFKQVSRTHAQLTKVNGRWFIKDLGSINGVYVNQLRITKEEQLEIGDHIGLGIDNPSQGFVCALSVRNRLIKLEPIEIIDLSDDETPIKREPQPIEDSPSCSKRSAPPHFSAISVPTSVPNKNPGFKVDTTPQRRSTSSDSSQQYVEKVPDRYKYSNGNFNPTGKSVNNSREDISAITPIPQFDELKAQHSKPVPMLLSSVQDITNDALIKCTPVRDNQIHDQFVKNSLVKIPEIPTLDVCSKKQVNELNRHPLGILHSTHSFSPVQQQNSVEKVPDRSKYSNGNFNHTGKSVNSSREEISVHKTITPVPQFDELKAQHSKPVPMLPSSVQEITNDAVIKSNPVRGNQIRDQFMKNLITKIPTSDVCSKKQVNESNRHPVGISYSTHGFSPLREIASEPSGLTSQAIAKNMKECYVKLTKCDPLIPKLSKGDDNVDKKLCFKPKRPRILSSDSEEEENINKVDEEEQLLDDDFISYSQAEEVIIINSDDDDEYYNFNPSQIGIKTEPMDEDELDVKYDREAVAMVPIEDIHSGTDNLDNTLSMKSVKSSHFHPNDENMNSNSYETIDDIRKFIETTSKAPSSELIHQPKLTNVTKSGIHLPLSRELIQECESDSSKSSHDDIIIPSKDKVKAKAKPPVKKSIGKTLPTAPKPMTHRPRCRRGREEWFEEKTVERSFPSEQKSKLKTPRSKASPKKNTYSHKRNLKDFKIPKKVKSDGSKTPDRVRNSVLSAVEVPTDQTFSRVHSGSKFKKKAPTIARKPGKPSRSEFLSASEPTKILPRRPPAKPQVSPIKKSINLVNERNASKGISNGETMKKIVQLNTNLTKPTKSSHGPHQVIPKDSNIGAARDPRLNRGNQPKPLSSLTPVYPAGDKFIPDLNTREYNPTTAKNNILSKYSQNATRPVTSSAKGESGFINHTNRWTLMKKIVQLNTKWLEEHAKKVESMQHRGKSLRVKPPPDVIQNIGFIPLTFSSLDKYESVFTPFLMLETWEIMSDSWKECQNNQRFYFVILSEVQKQGMKEYYCESVVNNLSFSPMRGSIVILDIRVGQKVQPVFGYVQEHHNDGLVNKNMLSDAWQKVDPQWIKNGELLKFYVFVKDRNFSLKKDILMRGNGICNIGSKMNMMDNFQHLSKSPLCSLILSPTDRGFSLPFVDVIPSRGYNNDQMLTIESICKEMEDKGPKVILLQGPPGTGKSHTLIGLLEKLVFCSGKNKVLVVAPSNAAIDEIGQRLILLNRESQKGIMRFVRLGVPDQIGKALRPYTLDTKLEEQFKKCENQKREEIKKLEMDIENLARKKSFESDKNIKVLCEKISCIKRYLGGDIIRSRSHSIKIDILSKCNVVLSTLGSCSQNILTSTFRSDNCRFLCVIVDEACQCTELEILQTMAFRTNKLILIGDHQQLPATIHSDYAKEFGFERSMFERLHTCLTEKYHGSVPLLMLREQFRMNSEICKFPSKHFYQNKLFTSPSCILRDEKLFNQQLQKPYLVLDILESQEYNSSSFSKTNCMEAQVVVSLCEQLLARKMQLSIGVITPYQGQCSLYTEAFKNHPDYFNHIEVNTVDGFQGREKDVIILSCVRANRNGGIGFLACRKRLNVAITRARKFLIVCGCLNTLKQNPDWMALIDDARERKLIHSVTSVKEVPLLFKTKILRT